MKTPSHNGVRGCLIRALAGVLICSTVLGQELGALVQKAMQGDQAAYDQIVSTGFQAHELLKQGPVETASVRKQLRSDLRKHRDEALRRNGFVAHEWGASRFVLDGHNEIVDTAPETLDDLPAWVHVWSRQPRVGHTEFILKPVIHFYTERPVAVNVSVSSRDGMLTQWWPNVTRYLPMRLPLGQAVAWQAGGRLDWVDVLINPFDTKALMPVPEDSWWESARKIESAPVVASGASEKFLFYRGVSRARPLVEITVDPNKVTVKNPSEHTIKSLYVVSVRDGRMRYHALSTLGPKSAAMVDSEVQVDDASVEDAAPLVRALLEEALEEDGLYPAESQMVAGIWQKELFRTDGLRVIYMRPSQELEASLPLMIQPQPASLVRSFFAYVECLSPMGESEIKALIADLASDSFERREQAQAELTRRAVLCADLLMSARETAEDPEVQERLDQILSTARSPEQESAY